ncbi:MAG: hypothetical protein MRY83_12860, partial [Flavobacteriales bacterium]|nr:hypothetical protein [Flavobacteriales bacterium]
MKSFLFLTLLISSIGFNSKNNSIIQYANPSESEIVNPDNIKYLHLNSQKDFDNIEQFTNVTHV